MERAAIVLAGGQSKRFQTNKRQWIDKAQAKLFGKPLLIHVIEKVATVVDEVIVCANNDERKISYSKLLNEFSIENVKLCADKQLERIGGPLVAIFTGLETANANYCIILPCDVPLIQPKVVEHLFKAAKSACAAVPVHPSGRIEPLMMACRRLDMLCIAEILCKLSRNRPDDLIRGSSEIEFISTVGELKNYDPELTSFVNINSQGDLQRLPTRAAESGPIKRNVHVRLSFPTESEIQKFRDALKYYSHKNLPEAFNLFSSLSESLEERETNFWAGICRENEGKISLVSVEMSKNQLLKERAFIKAAQNYIAEAKVYGKNCISSLAQQASKDAKRCQSYVM